MWCWGNSTANRLHCMQPTGVLSLAPYMVLLGVISEHKARKSLNVTQKQNAKN